MSLTDGKSKQQQQQAQNIIHRVTSTKGPAIMHAMSGRSGGVAAAANAINGGSASMKGYAAAGFKPLDGYQFRYIYFLNRECRDRLTVPIIPFSKIEEMGAGMYRGEKVTRGKEQAPGDQPGLGGATPTTTLQSFGGD